MEMTMRWFSNKFELSLDPILLQPSFKINYRSGDIIKKTDILWILKNEKIFGIDLDKYGSADKVVFYLNKMNKGIGAVRKTLKEYV